MSTDLQVSTNPAQARVPVRAGERGLVLTSLDEIWRFANYVAKSGLAPKGMDAPETVLVAIQLGLELGLSPMAALQNIGVINGRPGIYGDAALALVRGSGLCESYTQKITGEGDSMKASVTSKRRGHEPMATEFSATDAKRAGLWGKTGPWSQYPSRMLLFRARGFNLRDNFGDVLKGFRTTEELADINDQPGAAPAAPPLGRHSLKRNGAPALPAPTVEPEPIHQEAEEVSHPPDREPGDEPPDTDEPDLKAEEISRALDVCRTEKEFTEIGGEIHRAADLIGPMRHEQLLNKFQQLYKERVESKKAGKR